jgi:adenosylmethionine-8-amino-7-oxononanoate aminotransferase
MKMEYGSFTTPFELVHKEKPDLMVLFKLFSLAAVCRECVGDDHLGKFDSQSVPMIAIGHCPNSNGLQFYNPVNNTFVILLYPPLIINYNSMRQVVQGLDFAISQVLSFSI